jgi:hypothetical protein
LRPAPALTTKKKKKKKTTRQLRCCGFHGAFDVFAAAAPITPPDAADCHAAIRHAVLRRRQYCADRMITAIVIFR